VKINTVNLLIALFVSALVAYGLGSVESGLANYVAIGTFVFMAGTLVPMIGLSFEYQRNAINLRIVCAIFMFVGLVINLFFLFLASSATAYIITSSILFLIYLLIGNSIYRARH